MKNLTLAVSFAVLSACAGAPDPGTGPTITLEPGTSKVRVSIVGVRNDKGTIYCSLFNAAEGFPGASPIIGGGREANANAGTLSFEFPELPAGTYAVSMTHDENDNGKVDMSLVGAPTEGYGVTNNITHATSGPKFEESKFDLAAGQVLEQQINVKY